MKKIVSFFLCIVMIFPLCACGSLQDKKVVGTWSGAYTDVEGHRYIRKLFIYDDGTLEQREYYNGDTEYHNKKKGDVSSSVSGTWEISSGVLRLTLLGIMTRYVRYQLDLENNKMSLINPDYNCVLIKQE